MQSFMFCFQVQTGKPIEGFILLTLFGLEEKYAKMRALHIMKDAFPHNRIIMFNDEAEWKQACLDALEDSDNHLSPVDTPKILEHVDKRSYEWKGHKSGDKKNKPPRT